MTRASVGDVSGIIQIYPHLSHRRKAYHAKRPSLYSGYGDVPLKTQEVTPYVTVLFLISSRESRVPKRPITVGKTDVQVRMDESLKLALQARAQSEGRSLAGLIAYAARVYLGDGAAQRTGEAR